MRMSTSRSRQALLGLAALAAFAGTAAAQTLTNGDFETNDLTGWTVVNTVNGVGAPGSVTVIDIDGPGPLTDSPAATFGVGLATFQSGQQGGVEMTQSVNLTAGTTYTLSFDWSAQRTIGANNAEGGVFSIIVDGMVIETIAAGGVSSPSGTHGPKYGSLTGSFTPTTSGAAEVGIRITRPYTVPGDVFQYVDNVVLQGGTTGGCYANCDESTAEPVLNVADFGCFLQKFAAGDPYANCDGSTAEPVLNVADFGCFLQSFAAGCP